MKAGFNIYSEAVGTGLKPWRRTIGVWESNNKYDTPHQGKK